MGSYYVPNPNQYTQVAAYSVARDITIPSGASIVHGIYYMWNDRGFTGKGWMTDVPGGPTGSFPGFETDQDVDEYLATNKNLNEVFEHWSDVYTLDGWDAFYNRVGKDSGCMDVG